MTQANQADGRAILAAIHYVRDFHRTVAKMLLAADAPLGERGWMPHGQSWKPVPGPKRSIRSPDRWMPHFILRQYFLDSDPKRAELLTLAVVPFDPIDNHIEEPVCLASRVRTLLQDDKVYWVPQLQLRCVDGIGPLGEVRHITRDTINTKASRVAAFDAVVEGGSFLSVVIPLVSVFDEASMISKLIEPILGAQYGT